MFNNLLNTVHQNSETKNEAVVFADLRNSEADQGATFIFLKYLNRPTLKFTCQ